MASKEVFVGNTPVNCPSCSEDRSDMLEDQGTTISRYTWFFCKTCSRVFGVHPDGRTILSNYSIG